ncbi:extracellular solute-binding protein [Marinithermofilum abyssi]|nr:extracellular solute-binding protein [Marinithermofilum abyssi]
MKKAMLVFVSLLLAVLQAACSYEASKPADSSTIKVAYRYSGPNTGTEKWLKKVKQTFEERHPGKKVEIIPIQASEGTFFAKLALMMKSADTAPDVVAEDTFMINADAAAGYIEPLTERVKGWDDWDNFNDRVKKGVTTQDGSIYGVPFSTDTRGIWYNKNIFKKAGLPVPWQPENWNDILTAARTIKEKVPGVTPFWSFTGRATGEATAMQTFEMLLYGTDDPLYDEKRDKWVVKSPGILHALRFIDHIYSNGLGPPLSQVLNGTAGNTLAEQSMPEEKVAMALHGSFLSGSWVEGGPAPWPEGTKVYGFAPMPTERGQDPGKISLSGGWALSISAKSKHKDLAWEFIKLATNKENNKYYVLNEGDLTPRDDVAEDPEYQNAPGRNFQQSTEFLEFTDFRPGNEDYPAVSTKIQIAVESVATGKASPEQAMEQYAQSVEALVGPENVMKKE